jgi:antitoxin (DNA-binding transcriptional repressor) of toxin-antitoxin stability system
MDKRTHPTSVMSLSALRPELFRLVPTLRETGEVVTLTHRGEEIAVLSPIPRHKPPEVRA